MFSSKQAVRVSVVVALIATASSAFAQNSVKAATNSSLARAIALHDSAVSLYSQPNRAADAARLHVQEAKFRGPNDPEAVDALIMAGNLFNYANQLFTAKKTMEQAAERALAMGNVTAAAQSYTNAAFVAYKDHNNSETVRLGRKAILLSASPFIDEQQRSIIRNRFSINTNVAALLK